MGPRLSSSEAEQSDFSYQTGGRISYRIEYQYGVFHVPAGPIGFQEHVSIDQANRKEARIHLQAIENGIPSDTIFHNRCQQFMAAREIVHRTG